ncbi:MAG: isochorismatase family protein [Saprospiraceae bacterium]|jgi:maleamate amidohydrolase|nr:isochorismatase family protein [Saprospiraceae bacterium]
MELSNKTARQIYHEVKANPSRAKFGFGAKAAIINIDLQKAYTKVDEFKTAYETDPNQIQYINEINRLARSKGLPVIFTYVAYMDSAEDAGVWGTRTNTPDSLQNIKFNSRRAEFDDRLEVFSDRDLVYCKKMPSPFFETPLQSLLVWHKVDTVIITGGSTSGCVRAAAVDALSRGYRTIVPEECVADKHESYHFANLTDMLLKYADVVAYKEVIEYLQNYRP